MVRAGMIRLHWVTEWQRRGVPHLHGAIWFPDKFDACRIVDAWIAVAGKYGAAVGGQFTRPIDGVVGWFQYLSKHAVRGVKHYQRHSENIPPSWQKKTGRMWGKSGEWPVRASVRINLQDQNGDGGYFAYRRLARAWRVSDARSAGDARRIRTAREMLKCSDRTLSTIRGLSEWIPEHVSLSMIANLASRGFEVTS